MAVKAKPPLECKVQAQIIDAIRWCVTPVDVRAVPNATGWLSPSQRGKLKREGRTPGTLDLIIAWPNGVGFIEVKRPGFTASAVSDEQSELLERWGGWLLNVGIASSPDEALALLRAWGAPVRTMGFEPIAAPVARVIYDVAANFAGLE